MRNEENRWEKKRIDEKRREQMRGETSSRGGQMKRRGEERR